MPSKKEGRGDVTRGGEAWRARLIDAPADLRLYVSCTNKVARARGWGPFSDSTSWVAVRDRRSGERAAWSFCSRSRSHRSRKKRRYKLQLFSLTHIYFFGRTTCATTFAQTTYTRAVSSMAARARSGWAEAPLSGGIGHLAGTETTESDARVK